MFDFSANHRYSHWWSQRYLLWEFLKRDLQARYVGSAMGLFWSVIHPMILLVLYTVVFGKLLQVPTGRYSGENFNGFALYIFCGLLPWYALQESVVRSTTCVVDHAHLIRQVRFPAKVLPAYLVLSSIVNQLIGTAVFLVALFLIQGIPFSIVMLPLALLFQAIFTFGLGLLLATLHTYLRDVAPLVTIGLMVCMWMSPLFYEFEVLAGHPLIRNLELCNPFTHFIMLYHEIFLATGFPSLGHWVAVMLFSIAAFIIGYKVFTGAHEEFADVL